MQKETSSGEKVTRPLTYRGWIINLGDGKGLYRFRTSESESAKGWICNDSKSTLFDFLGWLSAVMPRIIRYDPILPQYLFSRR